MTAANITPPTTESQTAIKARLIKNLRDACELEHQFMCQYLYAALSIKKVPDATCQPYQVEMARRWASTIYMVARQEMEHLALANNLLRSIGAAPYFYRTNIKGEPTSFQYSPGQAPELLAGTTVSTAESQSEDYALDSLDGVSFDLSDSEPTEVDESQDLKHVPKEQKYTFEPLTLDTIKRFVCMESPSYENLCPTDEVTNDACPPNSWCFQLAKHGPVKTKENTFAGFVGDLYKQIREDFKALDSSQFVNAADKQVNISQQYDVFVFPVTDHASAEQAINLIVKQGEAVDASPTYQSHFRRFMDVYEEYKDELDHIETEGKDFHPGYLLKTNPRESDTNEQPYTQKVFELFNHAYGTLLLMLTALYATPMQNPTSYPYFAPALGQEVFAPFMTMVIRTFSEVLVLLKADKKDAQVGPNFYIDEDLEQVLKEPYEKTENGERLKPDVSDINCMLKRIADFSDRLRFLVEHADGKDGKYPQPNEKEVFYKLVVWDDKIATSNEVKERMRYLLENAERITANLRRIYQQGIDQSFKTSGY